MKTKKRSVASLPTSKATASKNAKATKPKTTKLGRILVAGAKEMLSHIRGEIELESYFVPVAVDVKAIRSKSGMSQAEFARAFALGLRTLQEWEQGKAIPDTAVRAYLTVIDRDPAAVTAALRR